LVIERDRQLTYLSAARLRNELTKFSDELHAVARRQEISGGDLESQRQALRDARNRLVIFDGGVVLLDNRGRVRASEPARPELIAQDWSDRDFFYRLLEPSSVFLSDIVEDRRDGSLSVVMSVPVVGENNEMVGVLVGMFRLGAPTTSAFYASIVRLRLGQSGTTYVVDGNGRVLYDSSYSEIGEPLSIPDLPVSALRGEVGAVRTRDVEGNEVVAAFAPVPGSQWVLITEDDWDTLFGSVRQYARLLALVLGLGMILPTLGVTMLIRQRHMAALDMEKNAHEDRVASLIQQRLLPSQAPVLPGWNLVAHYQPGAAGGRDFYDFAFRPDGCLVLTLASVDDRGLAAAYVISSARAILRGTALRQMPPGEALECSNTLVCSDIAAPNTVACLYAVLEPSSGRLAYANASHLPFYHGSGEQAPISGEAGAPLGLALDSRYSHDEIAIRPGELLVFCSDGLLTARNAHGEMFGPARLESAMTAHTGDAWDLLAALLASLREFTGKQRTTEDDVTLLVLQRVATGSPAAVGL
jgi:serine phosphatase RsbU (regulator of sigma subunit)